VFNQETHTTAGMPVNDVIVNNARIIRRYNGRESLFNESGCDCVMRKERLLVNSSWQITRWK